MTGIMILDHISIVVAALLCAIVVGVPLGILSYFYPSARKIILRVVDLLQTTPALALLGIIMVFLGAGKPTVIIGLALYSLLPIVRNTCLGLNQVPDYLVEAGKGMGMSRMQRLLRVEMPLATPSSSRESESRQSTRWEPPSLPPSWAAAAWGASSTPASGRMTWQPSLAALAC